MHNFSPPNQTQIDILVDALSDALADVPCAAPLLVVLNDADRATPTALLLDALFAARPDLRPDGLVACGTHRFTLEQRRAHERAHRLERLRSLHWHDATQPDTTERLLADPGLALLGLGSVEPHWFAGWTGAHKTLTVGIWPRARIERNHAHALSPRAASCRLADNPVHCDLAEAVRELLRSRSAPVRAVNVVLAPAAAGEAIAAAAAGDPLEALHGVLPTARQRYLRRVPQPLDRLIAHVAAPLDRSLYQALKGLTNHADAVRPGGAMLLVAGCPEGVGIDHFMALLRDGGEHDALEKTIATQGYRLGDHKALRQRELIDRRGLHLGLVACDTPLDPADAAACGFAHVFDDLDAARAWARRVAPGPRELELDDAAHRVTVVRSTAGCEPD